MVLEKEREQVFEIPQQGLTLEVQKTREQVLTAQEKEEVSASQETQQVRVSEAPRELEG